MMVMSSHHGVGSTTVAHRHKQFGFPLLSVLKPIIEVLGKYLSVDN